MKGREGLRHLSCIAPRREVSPTLVRGLKPTATVSQSLRDVKPLRNGDLDRTSVTHSSCNHAKWLRISCSSLNRSSEVQRLSSRSRSSGDILAIFRAIDPRNSGRINRRLETNAIPTTSIVSFKWIYAGFAFFFPLGWLQPGLISSSLARASASFWRMSSTLAVQINGLGFRFQASKKLAMAVCKSGTLTKLPRRIAFSVNSANQRSTKFNQLELVGMKWQMKRRCFLSHARTCGSLCVP